MDGYVTLWLQQQISLLTDFKLSLYSFAAWFSVFDLLHVEIFHYFYEPRQKCTVLSRENNSNRQSFQEKKQQ